MRWRRRRGATGRLDAATARVMTAAPTVATSVHQWGHQAFARGDFRAARRRPSPAAPDAARAPAHVAASAGLPASLAAEPTEPGRTLVALPAMPTPALVAGRVRRVERASV